MARLFGTDGVRGVANTELTPEMAMALGKAATLILTEDKKRPVFIIGKDTRISGDMLEDALSAGILSMGGDVIKAGVIPTPAIAYLVRELGADAGVVISASHNPFEYNGIKFFNGDGFKLDDAVEDRIAEYAEGKKEFPQGCAGAEIGRIRTPEKPPVETYAKFVESCAGGVRLDGVKLVLDCANGASYVAAESIFKRLGAEVAVISDKPDGININDKCGSTHPERLCEAVKENNADMGLAFDGDADRLIAVDEKGNVVDGDAVIGICAKLLKEEGHLRENRVAVTIMSNLGFHKYAQNLGIDVDVTGVGDRYVLESMLKTGCVIGGEQSGHIIFLEHSTTGDGMIAALQLVRAYLKAGKPLSQMAAEMVFYPQVLVNAKVKNENKYNYMENKDVADAINALEAQMADEGRVVIRPSGTEPVVRVMLEGSDTEKIEPLARNLAALIEEKLS